uniref:Uncharacterized protein n=1 Tax=Moniliophthora roreri TaxID=221103 RepID=A0A0W0FFL4_MONRR
MGCFEEMIWMNTTSGVLFSGPDGPDFLLGHLNPVGSIVVPSTVDMLKDDTSFRFFSKFGSSMDNSVLECALSSWKMIFLEDVFPQMAEDHQSKDADHPNWSSVMPYYLQGLWHNPPNHLLMDIIGGLQFNTIYSLSLKAVARWPQGAGLLCCWSTNGLVGKTELDGGLIRFKLCPVQGKDVYLEVDYDWSMFGKKWLLQSSHVFDALNITKGKENFFIIAPPYLKIQSIQHPTISPHNAKYSIEETLSTPIYLFLHPLPTTVLELVSWMEGISYFWSFNETGQSQMSEEECEQWGLPVLTFNTGYPRLRSWPTHVYTALQDWQKAQGFNPTTSEWAQSMGYPEFEIISTREHKDCFVLIEETSDESEMSDEDSEWEVVPDA